MENIFKSAWAFITDPDARKLAEDGSGLSVRESKLSSCNKKLTPAQSLESYMRRHAKIFVEEGHAAYFDGSPDSLMPSIIEYGCNNRVTPIMVGNIAMAKFANMVVKELKPIYGIFHGLEIDGQTVYCEYTNLELSAIDLAVYFQIKAEDVIDSRVLADHSTIAKYLELFGAKRKISKPSKNVIGIDMYEERECRVDEEWMDVRFVWLDSQYGSITEAFIKEQRALDSSAFDL